MVNYPDLLGIFSPKKIEGFSVLKLKIAQKRGGKVGKENLEIFEILGNLAPPQGNGDLEIKNYHSTERMLCKTYINWITQKIAQNENFFVGIFSPKNSLPG